MPGPEVELTLELRGGDRRNPAHHPAVPADRRAARMAELASGVEALQLGRSQLPLQDSIVAELRAGVLHRPPAAIAQDVASFGIGAGQAQAAAWRKLIADIEALPQAGEEAAV